MFLPNIKKRIISKEQRKILICFSFEIVWVVWMKNHEKKQKRVLLFTILLIILTLFFTFYLVINDIASKQKEIEVDLSTPEATVASLEGALFKNSYIMLDKIFYENRYSTIFGELFFDKIVSVRFGYSNDSTLNQQRIITSLDFPKIKEGELKYLTDNAAIAIMMIDEVIEPNNIAAPVKNILNVAFLIQKFNGEWKITKLYDFVSIDSDFLEVKDFNLHYLDNRFYLALNHVDYGGFTESTVLYNIALQIQNISVIYEDEVLCSFGPESIRIFLRDHEFKLRNDQLNNPDKLTITGTCDYSKIITNDPEDKYLLYIVIKTKEQEFLVRYYGDLLL
jgi:hypothetical protein